MARTAWWLGFALAVALALGLTWGAYHETLPQAIATVEHLDKVIHVGVAGLLAATLDGALGRRDVGIGRLALPVSALLVLGAGAVEEFLQRFSQTRESNIWDFAADVVGVALFTWTARRLVYALGHGVGRSDRVAARERGAG